MARNISYPRKWLSLNGTSSYATIPVSVGTSFSVAFWTIKGRLTGSNNDRIFDCTASGPANGFSVLQGTGNKPIRLEIYTGSQTAAISTTDLSMGKPHFIVCTFTTNSAKIYHDGNLINTDTSCSMGTVATTLHMGRRSASSANFYKGWLGDAMFFNNKVLTQSEITDLYTNGVTPSGATVTYDFENDVVDGTGNGNDATLTSGSYELLFPPRGYYKSGSNKALNFSNSTTAKVTVTTNSTLTWYTTGKLTLFCRLYITRLNGNDLPRIIEKGGHYTCWMGDQTNARRNQLALEIGDGSPAVEFWGSTRLEHFVWYDVATTWDASTGSCQHYINGVPEQMTVLAGPYTNDTMTDDSASDLKIGNSSADRNTPGLIKDVQQFNVVLTEEEIKDLGKGIEVTRGRVGKWDMDEGSGSTTLDSSGNGYNGTITLPIWETVY